MKTKKPKRINTDIDTFIKGAKATNADNFVSTEDKQSKHIKQQSLPSIKIGLKEGWTRATIIVQDEQLSKLKALAYWERKDIKEVVEEAFTHYLKDKKIKPVP